jgi:hypothetical protein
VNLNEKCYTNIGKILNRYRAMGKEIKDDENATNTFAVKRNDSYSKLFYRPKNFTTGTNV